MNRKFKYVTVGGMDNPCRSAIIFPELINHNEAATKDWATTAGFCAIKFTGKQAETFDGDILDVVRVKVFGKSTTLKLETHESDCKLIAETLGCILHSDDLKVR